MGKWGIRSNYLIGTGFAFRVMKILCIEVVVDQHCECIQYHWIVHFKLIYFIRILPQFSSVAQTCLTLQPHESQCTRPPCPSPTPRVYSDSCPLSQWCHPTISFCHPLLLSPTIFPRIRVFSNESVLCIRWPKYWSFSFSISLSNEY